jgi:hypothetical protein
MKKERYKMTESQIINLIIGAFIGWVVAQVVFYGVMYFINKRREI